MATAATDFSGLFGGTLTPEEQQRQLTEARAAQFASMAPSQQLAFMGYKAGAGLGQGLAQAAGVDIQDPTIKRAMQLRQLAQGIDPNSVEGLTEYANRLARAGFNAEAYQISDKIRAARKTESEITKNLREKEAALPFQQFLRAAVGKVTPSSLAKYEKSGNPQDLEWIDKPVKGEIKEVGVALGTNEPVYTYKETPDAVPKQIIFKSDASGNQTMVPYSGGVDITKTKVSATAGMGKFSDVPNLRKNILSTIDIPKKAFDSAETAEVLATDALRTGNFASAEGLASQLAKASGDTQLSNKDVEKYRGDPSFVGRVSDVVTRLFKGTPTKDTLEKLQQYARVLKEKHSETINRELEVQKDLARRTKMFTDGDIDAAFSGITTSTREGKILKTKSGVSYQVIKD